MELAADEEAVLSCGDLALAADADAAGVAYEQSTYDVHTFSGVLYIHSSDMNKASISGDRV